MRNRCLLTQTKRLHPLGMIMAEGIGCRWRVIRSMDETSETGAHRVRVSQLGLSSVRRDDEGGGGHRKNATRNQVARTEMLRVDTTVT